MEKNRERLDYLIVGGGISGCLLALKLKMAGVKVQLYSHKLVGEASSVSSGLINPVTGLRFVKSWNFENLRLQFLKDYQFIEHRYNNSFIYQHEILVDLTNVLEENNWQIRLADPLYKEYCGPLEAYKGEAYKMKDSHSFGKIRGAIRVNIKKIIDFISSELESDNLLSNELFDYNHIQIQNEHCHYKQWTCQGIIFCEGFYVAVNPFFSWLPIVKLKGERLLLQKEFQEEDIYHSTYTLIPTEESVWLGSNYNLKETHCDPTESEKCAQLSFAQNVYRGKLNLLDHSVGIRAATRDRRPILGRHPRYKQLMILNGLGTKGASLAPFCSEVMLNMLCSNLEIPDEINIKRFVKLT